MIKSESKQNSTNVLERLRIMSESITEKQVLELFENSAHQIYSDHFVRQAQNLVNIQEIEQNGDNGLELLHTLTKMYKQDSFDALEIRELLKIGVGIEIPDCIHHVFAFSFLDLKNTMKLEVELLISLLNAIKQKNKVKIFFPRDLDEDVDFLIFEEIQPLLDCKYADSEIIYFDSF